MRCLSAAVVVRAGVRVDGAEDRSGGRPVPGLAPRRARGAVSGFWRVSFRRAGHLPGVFDEGGECGFGGPPGITVSVQSPCSVTARCRCCAQRRLAASFTRTQVADFLGVSRQTVSDMAADGRSSGSRTGGSGGSRPGSSPPTGPTRSCPTSTDSHARESSRQGPAAGIPQSQSRNGWRRITTTA